MRRDRGTDIWPRAVHNVEHAVWQSSLATNFAEQVGRHRRQLARFGDGGVADRDGRRDFPAHQIERQIPGRDQSGDAARLTQRVVKRDVVGDVRFRFGVQDCGRKKAKVGHGARNVEPACERERLAGVDRFSPREFLEIALDQIGDAQEDARPFCRRFSRPIGERSLGRGYGKIDITTIAVRDLGIGLACRRFDVVEITPTERLNKLAVSEVLGLD